MRIPSLDSQLPVIDTCCPLLRNSKSAPLPIHSSQPLLLLPRLFLLSLNLLPPHEVACTWEEQGIDDDPNEKYGNIETDT